MLLKFATQHSKVCPSCTHRAIAYFVLVVSNDRAPTGEATGRPVAGGAAGRVAALPDDAPLPMLPLLPPPPRFRLSSSSSTRAFANKILKNRANRLQAQMQSSSTRSSTAQRRSHVNSYHHKVKQINAIQKFRSERHFFPMLPA